MTVLMTTRYVDDLIRVEVVSTGCAGNELDRLRHSFDLAMTAFPLLELPTKSGGLKSFLHIILVIFKVFAQLAVRKIGFALPQFLFEGLRSNLAIRSAQAAVAECTRRRDGADILELQLDDQASRVNICAVEHMLPVSPVVHSEDVTREIERSGLYLQMLYMCG